MNQRTADQRRPEQGKTDAGRQVDRSGEAIIALLHQAAESAQADCDRALQAAHQYSMQLRAAEDRAEKLQAQVQRLEQQAVVAEDWMRRIQGEIESRFLHPRPAAERRQS